MNSEDVTTGKHDDTAKKGPSISVKIGSGDWYAIPASMAEAFRKAGAAVRENDAPPKPPPHS